MHGSTKQRSFSRTITAQISFFRHELKHFDAGRSTCKYSRVNRNCPKAKYSFSCAASRPLSNRLRLPLFSFVSEELGDIYSVWKVICQKKSSPRSPSVLPSHDLCTIKPQCILGPSTLQVSPLHGHTCYKRPQRLRCLTVFRKDSLPTKS